MHQHSVARIQRAERLQDAANADTLAAILQAQLSAAEWARVQAEWEQRTDLCLPGERLGFLVDQAVRLDHVDLIPDSVFTGV